MKKMYFTSNEAWGFFGTSVMNYGISNETAKSFYSKVCYILMQETDASAERVQEFLDSRMGRHFADEISFHGAEQGSTEKQLIVAVKKTLIASKWIKNQFHGRKLGREERAWKD